MRNITSAVMGLAVGDALGMPYETAKRGSFDIYKDTENGKTMIGYSKGMPAYWYEYDMPPGVWTDDTAMTLAEMESIARLHKVDIDDIMQNFCRWNYDNEFTATGIAIGQGRRTVAALKKYRSGVEAKNCGGKSEDDNGNGSLMRMLPFVFCEKLMKESKVTVAELSSITHAHPISVNACEIYVDFGRKVLCGESRDGLISSLKGLEAPFDRLSRITELTEDDIQSTGYVVYSLETALWCFLTTDSYMDCILKAVNLGGDTDTNAAIAGGLAGMYYGIESIPKALISRLYRSDLILEITEKFSGLF